MWFKHVIKLPLAYITSSSAFNVVTVAGLHSKDIIQKILRNTAFRAWLTCEPSLVKSDMVLMIGDHEWKVCHYIIMQVVHINCISFPLMSCVGFQYLFCLMHDNLQVKEKHLDKKLLFFSLCTYFAILLYNLWYWFGLCSITDLAYLMITSSKLTHYAAVFKFSF